ncbi:HAD superfamily hydrolase (TIGR01490 family) [Sphingobium sp. B1D7B]|nr:HAD superfamily hydrolase (TIGR01490 family) [Sphingobium sp. B11D3A]MCW2404039.1 HAD superfamily hydrolase (TIGR01490 family) [Sphingobium sp. B1D7B]
MQRIAIYDMDRTITVRGTYAAFLTHMALSLAPWRLIFLPLAGIVMLGYVLRLVDRGRAKELNQALLIGRRVNRERIRPAVEAYADKVIARNIRAGALAQIAQDRASGCRLVIASASFRLYVEPIAKRLGFDDVIATDHFSQGVDYIRARIAGENCYDVAKLRMIEAWMSREGIARDDAHVRAYSDHVTDAPLLGFADEGYAANPHRALASLAAEEGWPVLHW